MPTKPDERRRGELLASLECIMLGEGFSAWRVGQLASRLNCSRSTLYRLAPSKEALVLLLIDSYVRAALTQAKREGDTADTPAAAIIAYTEAINREQKRGSMRFWGDVGAWTEADALIQRHSLTGVGGVRSYLDAGVSSGEFRPANTEFLAHIIWQATRQTRDPVLLEGCGIDAGEGMQELGRFIVYGMGWTRE